MAEINVVPYIDVMLVLLVIFMVTAPMLQQGVKVNLPQAPATPLELPKHQQPLIISVKADGSYYMDLGAGRDGKALTLDQVTKQVGIVLKNKPATQVLVQGDKAANYGQVVQLMSGLQAAGVAGVGLLTEPPVKP
jgi:biopolymer transport protein TolR